MTSIWRRIVATSDFLLCLLLFGAGVGLVRGITHHQNADQAATMATLAGALFGAGAVLLGNWINRLNDRQRTVQELTDRRAQLKALISAELVDQAAGLIGAHEFIQAALEAEGGRLSLDLRRYWPRDMAFTDRLGSEILVLEQPAISALASLRSNLAVSRLHMEEIAGTEGGAWGIHVAGVLRGIKHTIGVLAEAFQYIAPDSRLALQDHPPELATDILSRLAQTE